MRPSGQEPASEGEASISTATPHGAHLVGSMPLKDAETVMRTCAELLGDHLERVPDGETGDRANWIVYQSFMLADHPFFEEVPNRGTYGESGIEIPPSYQVRAGIDPASVTFPSLGYRENALSSYEIYRRLREERAIPEHLRFQVALPTPLATVIAYVALRDQAAAEGPYRDAMLREVGEICAAIPADQLAIQLDVCNEVGIWEEVGFPCEPWFDNPREGSLDRIVPVLAAVPEEVQLGMHLCYGDYGHEHFVQPRDAGVLVEMANGIFARAPRRIDYIHLPVPRDRDDTAYFKPMRDLRLPPETKLFLGLVHMTDGMDGTTRRIEAAQRFAPDFGVATECGFGRRPSDQVPTLLRLHANVSEPIAGG